MANHLTLAVAGSRKTQGIVERCAVMPQERRVLVLTYTQANQEELTSRLKQYAGDRHHVEVMGWFTFLLRHFAKPFLPFKFAGKRVLGFNFDGRPKLMSKGIARFMDPGGAVYVDQLLRSSRKPPKHHKLIVRQISALALWDLDLAGFLAAQPERVLFDVKTVLKAARAALDINAALKEEAWEAGGSNQVDGAEMTHPFVLVEQGDPDRELSRRLWTAQAAELLPMIEVRRRELLKGLERRRPLRRFQHC